MTTKCPECGTPYDEVPFKRDCGAHRRWVQQEELKERAAERRRDPALVKIDDLHRRIADLPDWPEPFGDIRCIFSDIVGMLETNFERKE